MLKNTVYQNNAIFMQNAFAEHLSKDWQCGIDTVITSVLFYAHLKPLLYFGSGSRLQCNSTSSWHKVRSTHSQVLSYMSVRYSPKGPSKWTDWYELEELLLLVVPDLCFRSETTSSCEPIQLMTGDIYSLNSNVFICLLEYIWSDIISV